MPKVSSVPPPVHPEGEVLDPISARRVRDTDELLERERAARRQLETDKTVRERLLAVMTRELMTHANVAKGWLRLIRQEHLDGTGRGTALAKIDAALSAQLSLLDDLVGISPAAEGHVSLDCKRVDVAKILRAVAADVGDDRARVVATEEAIAVMDVEHLIRALRSLIDATTRAALPVELQVAARGDSVLVRFSSAVSEGDDALAVARRVATLYGGEVSVTENETLFMLPFERSF